MNTKAHSNSGCGIRAESVSWMVSGAAPSGLLARPFEVHDDPVRSVNIQTSITPLEFARFASSRCGRIEGISVSIGDLLADCQQRIAGYSGEDRGRS